jgi:CRP-like cAMP-binding protein
MRHAVRTASAAPTPGDGTLLERRATQMFTKHPDASPSEATRAAAASQLLAGLPAGELEPLLAGAERVRPRMRQELFAQGAPMESAWFPLGGVFSLLVETAGGGLVEILTIGNEGMVGLPAVLGASRSPTRAICQIAGWALRIRMATLREVARPGSVLHGRLVRYAQARMTSLSRSVACNRLHSAQQRYARWVLTTQDRVGADEFPITQDFLAQMLGVTRPTISQVGQELQGAGLIHYAQGRLTVDDRAGVERVACDCYAAVRAEFDELLGSPRG